MIKNKRWGGVLQTSIKLQLNHSVGLEGPHLFNRPLALLHLTFETTTLPGTMDQELATEEADFTVAQV
jgi:hypothetical protein